MGDARRKREAEPIDAGYGIPQALPLTLPVPLVHNAPAPILNHFVHPAPVAPTPIAPVPVFFPDARNFVPVNQVFQPNQFSFVPAPQAEALALPQVPAPVAQIPAQLALASGPLPLPFPQGPAPLAFAQGPAPLALAQGPAPLAFAQGPAPLAVAPAPSSQFHAQDEFGQFSFGYENINSAKTE